MRRDFPLRTMAELVVGAYLAIVFSWGDDREYPLGERLSLAAGLLGEAVAPVALRGRRCSS